MEKSDKLVAIPFDGIWSDLGSWNSISVLEESKISSASSETKDTILAIDCKNSLLRNYEKDMQLVGLGLENVIAIAMRDAVLVAS